MKIAVSTLVLALSASSLVAGLVEERQLLGDITSVAGGVFSDATSLGAGLFSTVTSAVANGATSVLPNEFSTVTSAVNVP